MGAFFRQAQNRQVVLRQAYHQLLVSVDLRIHRDFVFERRKTENLRKKAIGLLAVIELIVVRTGVAVLVKLEHVFLSIQFEKAPYVIEDVRLDQRRAETAV